MQMTVTPRDTGVALDNPGMGWILYYYDHHLARYGSRLQAHDTVDEFPGVTTVYMAVPWSFLEPREGRYEWSLLDTPAQRWISRGKRLALRFPCCEPFYEFATPAWVRDAGAVFHRFEPTARTRRWMRECLDADTPDCCWAPDYSDPIFLEKHGRFLAAAAERYDGNPSVAFIDVGSFGTWGEGHTYLSCGRRYDVAVKRAHLEMYARSFRRTLLVAGDDLLKDEGRDSPELVERAVTLGMSLRDDSVLVDNVGRAAESEEMAGRFWPRAPVILEPAHYGQAVTWWNTWGDGRLYVESVERYHASYAGVHWWPREFLAENRAMIERMNRRLGYRIQLTRTSWPARIGPGEPWTWSCTWRNAGVAPCLAGGHPSLTLTDARGGIAAVLVDPGLDVRDLPAGGPGREGEPVTRDVLFHLPMVPAVAPGRYSVLVSVGARDGTPRLALPLEGDDGQRRYRLGEMEVGGPVQTEAGLDCVCPTAKETPR